jgi:protein disulfide-isomerase A6
MQNTNSESINSAFVQAKEFLGASGDKRKEVICSMEEADKLSGSAAR